MVVSVGIVVIGGQVCGGIVRRMMSVVVFLEYLLILQLLLLEIFERMVADAGRLEAVVNAGSSCVAWRHGFFVGSCLSSIAGAFESKSATATDARTSSHALSTTANCILSWKRSTYLKMTAISTHKVVTGPRKFQIVPRKMEPGGLIIISSRRIPYINKNIANRIKHTTMQPMTARI